MSTGHSTHSGVLLIEDRQNLLDAYSIWLEEDFDVHTAATGAEGLACLRQAGSTIHLVLIDIHLPDMPGLEVVRQAKTLAPHLVVVTLSGLPDASLEAEARELGATLHLVKPFDLESTLALLHHLLNTHTTTHV